MKINFVVMAISIFVLSNTGFSAGRTIGSTAMKAASINGMGLGGLMGATSGNSLAQPNFDQLGRTQETPRIKIPIQEPKVPVKENDFKFTIDSSLPETASARDAYEKLVQAIETLSAKISYLTVKSEDLEERVQSMEQKAQAIANTIINENKSALAKEGRNMIEANRGLAHIQTITKQELKELIREGIAAHVSTH